MGVIITAEKRSRINQCDRFAVGWIEVLKAQDYYGLERCFALNRFWSMDDRRSFLSRDLEATLRPHSFLWFSAIVLDFWDGISRYRGGNAITPAPLERT
ncbi:MAG: hypothetical protein RLZZ435_3511 [Cyanobacteriota bacterium]